MTDLVMGRLSYGAANVGNLYRALTDEQAWSVLETAWTCGIRYFDTAPHYGLGLSERRLGQFLATKPRHAFTVSTKVGRLLRPNPDGEHRLDRAHHFEVPADRRRVWDFSADGVRRSLDESLERLGLDSVDVLYLHDPEEYDLGSALASGAPAAADLRRQGVVSAIGVGSKSTAALAESVRTELFDLVMVAGRLTLLEQPALDELVPLCRRSGVAVVSAAVFNTGLLASPEPPADARYEYGPVDAALHERARKIAAVCAEHGVELPAAALQYPMREPAVRTVVVGAESPDQVRQNAQRAADPIPDGLWGDLADRGLIPC